MALLEFANNERKQYLLMRPPHYCFLDEGKFCSFGERCRILIGPSIFRPYQLLRSRWLGVAAKKSSNAKAMRVRLALQNEVGDLALETACDKFRKQ